MANPFTSGLRQQANTATAPKNSVNEPNKHARLTHNTFDIGYPHACTMRYSDIHPFYVCEGVAGDKNPLYSTHELKTYTLNAPQMSGLSMKKGYFAVPYKAILPNNYDKIFVNPKKGDDVPDNANSVFSFSSSTFVDILRSASVPNDFKSFSYFLKSLFLLEMFYSNGSLLHALGYKFACTFNRTFYDGETFYSFDSLFDYFMGQLLNDYGVVIKVPRYDFDTSHTGLFTLYRTEQDIEINNDPAVVCSSQRMIELMRHNIDFEVVQIGRDDVYEESAFVENVEMFINSVFKGQTDFCSFDSRPLNYSRLIAYQLATNVFFSNDDVDYIYTANLYRQAQESLFATFGTRATFSYNGITTDYDVLSGRCVFSMLQFALRHCTELNSEFAPAYAFIFNIFQFNKSLRFSDYFLGSRINPLAVGDINAPVIGNNVSAINMTKSVSIQRFTNFVNKIPSTIQGYLRDMFGVAPAVDLTEPSYLGVTKSNIGGFEVENTSSVNQGKLVTNLSATGGDFAFEVDIADPCIIIGLAWFEQPRYYSATIERNMFHVDRFDDFQPMLQYIGDQDIKCAEFYAKAPYAEPYAYTLRNMEYKQRFAQATGGFVENLKGWLNVVDNPSEPQNMEEEYYYLNPDVIRSKAYEFDKYYDSLTGLSLGSYFHFQIVFHNKNNVTRPMAVAPEILA